MPKTSVRIVKIVKSRSAELEPIIPYNIRFLNLEYNLSQRSFILFHFLSNIPKCLY